MPRYIDAYKIPYHDLSDGKGLCQVAFLEDVNKVQTADVVECVQRNEEFDRVIEELLELEAKNDIGYFTSSERSQFNAYVEDLLSMTIERADT